jgi:ribosomal protein S18 acetylase RimI-like enzyme
MIDMIDYAGLLFEGGAMVDIKTVTPKALDEVFEFMVACDVATFGEADSSREDLEEQWGEMDLAQDAWIARDDKANLIGYASITAGNSGFTTDLFVHKRLSPDGIEDELMGKALNRGKELAIQLTPEKEVTLTGYAASVDERMQQVFEGNGFQRHTYHYRMQIDFEGAVEAPQWPPEYGLSNYMPSDEEELFQLIESTFNWEKHDPTTIESWRRSIFRGGRYDPEFFLMVRANGKLVGAALGFAEETGGWIRQLAVASGLQGKGLGSRLLRHMFSLFYRKNLPGVGLGVASTNSQAWQFYERVGMYRKREFIEYRKPLR